MVFAAKRALFCLFTLILGFPCQPFISVIVFKYGHLLRIPARLLREHQAHGLEILIVADLYTIMPGEDLRLDEQHQPVSQVLDHLLTFLGVTIGYLLQRNHRQSFQCVVVFPCPHVIEKVGEIQAQVTVYFFF